MGNDYNSLVEKMENKPLTAKQRKFVDEYLICLNATEAAKRAGYSADGARSMGLKNMAKPNIRKAISDVLDEVSSEKVASVQEVLEFLTAGMRGEHKELIPLGLGGGEQQLVEVPMAIKDRIKCAELLGKRYAIFTEKVELDAAPVIFIDDFDAWDADEEEMKIEDKMNSCIIE